VRPRIRACVGARPSACVRSKLDQIILQASKDATKAAAVKAAKQERRIATAMYAKWDSALFPSEAAGRHTP
jgi:hypothetical protein